MKALESTGAVSTAEGDGTVAAVSRGKEQAYGCRLGNATDKRRITAEVIGCCASQNRAPDSTTKPAGVALSYAPGGGMPERKSWRSPRADGRAPDGR